MRSIARTLRKLPLETELKYRLDRRSYLKLLKSLRCQRTQHFSNHYFDTPRLELKKLGFGLRIRIIQSKARVTLKQSQSAHTAIRGFNVRRECEVALPLATATAITVGKRSIGSLDIQPIRILKRIVLPASIERVSRLGSIQTTRSWLRLGGNMLGELDCCQMFSKRFHELEVETKNPQVADARVIELFKALSIPRRPSLESKLRQFLKEWQRRRRKKSC